MVEGKRIDPPVSEPERGEAEAGGRRHARARRRHAGPVGRVPGIYRRLDRRVVRAIGALGHLQLAQDHRARRFQSRHDGRVAGGNMFAMDRHAGGCRNARGVAEILHRDRHAVQPAARLARRSLGVEASGVLQRALGRHRGVAPELGIERRDAVEDRPSHLDRGQLACLQAPRNLIERQVVQIRRHAFASSASLGISSSGVMGSRARPRSRRCAGPVAGISAISASDMPIRVENASLGRGSKTPDRFSNKAFAGRFRQFPPRRAAQTGRHDARRDALISLTNPKRRRVAGGFGPLHPFRRSFCRLIQNTRSSSIAGMAHAHGGGIEPRRHVVDDLRPPPPSPASSGAGGCAARRSGLVAPCAQSSRPRWACRGRRGLGPGPDMAAAPDEGLERI